jgi:hypothetical protein
VDEALAPRQQPLHHCLDLGGKVRMARRHGAVEGAVGSDDVLVGAPGDGGFEGLPDASPSGSIEARLGIARLRTIDFLAVSKKSVPLAYML